MAPTIFMLSTHDNPYSPHTHFKEWLAFDTRKGYNTLGFLARLVRSSKELSESDQEKAYDSAILEIVERDVTGVYIRVPNDRPFLGPT